MVIVNGFVTGWIVGVICGIAGMCIYALIISDKNNKE